MSVLVCALVLLGIYLSLREFNDAKADAAQAGAAPVTTLGIDPTGVKLTSPVLGVIILVVSMGFFYLYLKTVYPINEAVEPPAAAGAQAPPAN